MAGKSDKPVILMYKNKPFVRKGDTIFYGDPDGKYIVTFILSDFKTVNDVKIAGKVDIQLQQNDTYMNIKNKLIKKAERDCLWKAIDIGAFWLEDAIEQSK